MYFPVRITYIDYIIVLVSLWEKRELPEFSQVTLSAFADYIYLPYKIVTSFLYHTTSEALSNSQL